MYNWKVTPNRKMKALNYLKTMLEEDTGKVSAKRVIALLLALMIIFIDVRQAVVAPYNYEWLPVIELNIAIFGFIATLLALTYIPTRK